MTVGMNRLNQMFRDFKVAEDVGKMMELRRFEVEFEVYGTVYWENGQRNYLVSKNETILCKQIAELEIQNKYPLPLQVWREKCLVPAGWDEEIEQQIKVHFCQALQKNYPAALWEAIVIVAEEKENDDGVRILEPIQEYLDGIFQAELLQLFEGLLNILYLRKNLSQRSFYAYRAWLVEMRQEMINDIAAKDVFDKVFFGFSYQKKTEEIHYVVNASQQFIEEKRLSILLEENVAVTPVFSKKCWYNYDYRLHQARKDFENRLRELYCADYFNILNKIHTLPVAVDITAYQEKQKQFQTEKTLCVWKRLGKQWGVVQ